MKLVRIKENRRNTIGRDMTTNLTRCEVNGGNFKKGHDLLIFYIRYFCNGFPLNIFFLSLLLYSSRFNELT